MDSLFINLGPFSVRTFTALIGAAVLIGLAAVTVAAYRQAPPDRRPRPLRGFDVGLGGLLGGVIGARLLHVALAWAYFSDHFGESFNLRAGGLSWHGALFGALIGLWLAGRWRRVPFASLGDALALVWPLGMMAGWLGCWASACGYGAEVWTLADFPEWAVSERADVFGVIVPRYNAQVFGFWLGAVLLLVMVLITLSGRLRGIRLWLALVLSGAGMFFLGFFRGDGAPSLLPYLSTDQVLDLAVIALGIVAMVGVRLRASFEGRRREASALADEKEA